MTKREAIRSVLKGDEQAYVPWSFSFTLEAQEKLETHFATLINHEVTAPGRHTVTFDGAGLTSGIYLYRLQVNGFSEVKKKVLQK